MANPKQQQNRNTKQNQRQPARNSSANVSASAGYANTGANDIPDHIKWLGCILLALFVAFIPALGNDFVNWDDFAYIVENPVIQSLSWSNIKYIFTPDTYVVGNYHPLTVLTYCIEYSLVGLKPFLFHFDNIILHAANTVLIYVIASKLLKNNIAVLVVTALFAVHPMRVESVAWAAERKDVLYTFFFLFAFYFYYLYTKMEKRKMLFYALSLFAFFLSILSKGQAVVLVVVIVALDWFLDRKFNKNTILEKIPYILLAIIFGIIAVKAQHTSLTTNRLESHTIIERMMFASYGLVMYLYKLLIPIDLSCFYAYPAKEGGSYPIMIYLAPPIALALIGLVIYKYRTNKTIIFCVLFFLGTVVIVLQLLPVGDAIYAERYTYVPFIGLFLLIGYIVGKYVQDNPSKQKLVASVLVIYFIVLTSMSFARSREWKNSVTLWSATIDRYPTTAVAYNNRAVILLGRQSLDSAYSDLNNAVKYKKDYFEAYSNLGNYYNQMKKYDAELEQYDKALSMNSSHANSLFNRGLCYAILKRYDLAIKDYETLVTLDPKNYRGYYSMGIAYKGMGRFDDAIKAYSKAIEINPMYDDAYNNRGNVYYQLANYDGAIQDYDTALKYNPNSANAYFNRSAAYTGKKNFQQALQDAQKARTLGYLVDEKYLDYLKSNIQSAWQMPAK